MMTGMSTDWFAGESHDPTPQAFLAELRAQASRTGLRDVRPGTTEVISAADFAVVALVPVPRLPTAGPKPTLQVALSTRDPDRPVLLAGWESWDYLLDAAEEIDTTGVPPEPVAWPVEHTPGCSSSWPGPSRSGPGTGGGAGRGRSGASRPPTS